MRLLWASTHVLPRFVVERFVVERGDGTATWAIWRERICIIAKCTASEYGIQQSDCNMVVDNGNASGKQKGM